MMNKNTLKLILIVPMIFLIVAPLYKFPYGLYILLRLIVFASSACVIYFSFKDTKELNVTVLIFGFIALLFNPFFPVHFPREVWMVLDFVTAFIYGYTFYKIKSV